MAERRTPSSPRKEGENFAGTAKQARQTVLIVNPGADLYGSDRMMLETLEALRDAGWHVVVSVPHNGPLVPEVRRRGGEIAFCRTPVVRKAALKPAGALRLGADVLLSFGPAFRLIRKVRPDVVYVSTVTPFLWLLVARLARRRVICHVHEGEATASRYVLKALNAPLFLAHRIVINSAFSHGVLGRAWPRLAARAQVIPNAVRGPAEIAPSRAELTEPYRLVYVGRLSPRKGPHVAVQAVRLLRERGFDIRLDLIGAVFPGYEWFEVELENAVAEAGLNEAVTFRGFHSQAWPWLAAGDVVLVPSTVDEPFGNTAVEAALAARPSVVSDIAGLKEAAEGLTSAVRVPAGDAPAVADGIELIVREWSSYRVAAAEDAVYAAAQYAPKSYADRIVETVEGVAR
jgi:glycosyltransferase involved in cell wall biosynthesis